MSKEKDKDDKKSKRLDLKGKSAQAIAEMVNNKYGENTLVLASEALHMIIDFISTGSHAVDFALGGGFPKNRITEVRGPESSYKSTLSLIGLANFQRKHKDGMGIYADFEHTFDPRYARELGVDLERLIVINPDSGEQGIDVMMELLESGLDLYVVIDSIAAIVPTAELEASFDQQSMGLHARLINRMMRILVSRIKVSMYSTKEASITVVALNQLRQKIVSMYQNPETTPGGVGKNFFFSTILRLFTSKSKAILEDVTINGIKRQIRFGQEVDFSVIKNKCSGTQHDDGSFNFYVRDYKSRKRYTFDNGASLFSQGLFYGVIEIDTYKGKPLFVFDKIRFASESRFIQEIESDEDVQSEIYTGVLAKVTEEAGGKLDLADYLHEAEKPKIKIKFGAK